MIKWIATTAVISLCYGNLSAQNHQHHRGDHSRHHIAIFNGLTTNFDHETTGYSLGTDYEYYLSDLIAIGFIGEYVFSGEGEWILGIPVFIHPTSNFKFGAAPIWIQAEVHHDDHHDDSHGDTVSSVEKEWTMGVRVNVAYNIHMGNLSAGPSVSLDITNTTAILYGFTFGVGF